MYDFAQKMIHVVGYRRFVALAGPDEGAGKGRMGSVGALPKERVMAQPLQSSVRNRLLAAMSAKDFRLLQGDLENVALKVRDVLVEPNKSIKYVHFMERGLASVIAESPGRE